MSRRTIEARRLSTRTLALVLIAALGLGMLAPAGAGAAATGREPSMTESVGPGPLLLAQAGGTSTAGSLDAAVDRLERILEVLMEKFPTGEKDRRETAFSILFVSYFAMLGGSLVFPPAGAAVGTGIGGIVGAAGFVTGPGGALTEGAGLAAGAAIGGGAGAAATMATWIGATMIMVPAAFFVNEHYAPTALVPWRDGVRLASAVPLQIQVPTTAKRIQASRAGPWESMLIHLMDSYYSDKLLQLAAAWDQMPGLTASQRGWLQAHNFLRPTIQRLAYIKEHKRLAPGSPVASPLTGLMGDIIKLVTADSATMRQAWLNALGLVGLRARVSKGVLTLFTPAPLRQLGAPASYTVTLPSIDVKVGGSGGDADPYVRATATPGPFDITWGVPSLSGDRIRVTYEIPKNATLGQGSLRYRWRNETNTISALSPRAGEDHSATVYFKPEGHILLPDQISAGALTVTASMPSLDGPLASLQGLLNDLGGPFRTATGNLVRTQLQWSSVLKNLGNPGSQSLLRTFQAQMGAHGLLYPKEIQQLLVQAGQLQARVKASKLLLPAPAATLQEVVAASKAPKLDFKPHKPILRYLKPVG